MKTLSTWTEIPEFEDEEAEEEDKGTTDLVAAAGAKEVVVSAGQTEKLDRTDDPVRMYLTQMGEIPLLSRKKELEYAKRIEIFRKRFRYLALCSLEQLDESVTVLEQVIKGQLAFDRTLKIPGTEETTKEKLTERLPHVVVLLRRNLERLHALYQKSQTPLPAEELEEVQRLFKQRRKRMRKKKHKKMLRRTRHQRRK